MPARIKRIEILEVDLPFKREFRHALHVRRFSNSIFLKVHLENGIIGYGESLPRRYVNEETQESVAGRLRDAVSSKIMEAEFSTFEKGLEFLERLTELDGAARCSIETALFDALGKYFNKPLSTVTGKPKKNLVFSSAVISADPVPSAAKSALAVRIFGFRSVKVKVGAGDDLKRLGIVRRILGAKADIRVDANCAWNADEAIEKIKDMRRFNITAVEQPVKPFDIEGLKKITDAVPETIIADESLATVGDAQRIARIKACGMFNIRLSKCGGILNALKIVDIARQNGIRYQLGCLAGESGLLSAAGRAFTCGVDGVEYYEGSYGRFLLKEDVTRENMTIGFGGRARLIIGPGLGVNIIDRVLDKYAVKRLTVS